MSRLDDGKSGGITESALANGPGPSHARYRRAQTFLLAAVVLGVDQIVKAAVLSELPFGGTRLGPLFHLRRVQNFGINFGLFADHPGPILLGTLSVGVGFMVYVIVRPPRNWRTLLGFGLMLGGGFSNVLDRLRLGYVFDFLNITPFVGYLNMADLAIGAGIVLLVADSFWRPD